MRVEPNKGVVFLWTKQILTQKSLFWGFWCFICPTASESGFCVIWATLSRPSFLSKKTFYAVTKRNGDSSGRRTTFEQEGRTSTIPQNRQLARITQNATHRILSKTPIFTGNNNVWKQKSTTGVGSKKVPSDQRLPCSDFIPEPISGSSEKIPLPQLLHFGQTVENTRCVVC